MTAIRDGSVPVSVLTGYLGSGKTTILSRLVRDPAYSDTAVILNEFGEVGLDHLLLETTEETIIDLSCGCICCTIRDDLMTTLIDLHARRKAGLLRRFRRVIIETTGLADPAPIIHTLMQEPRVFGDYSLASVVTVIDAVNALDTLSRQSESVKQAAVADVMLLSKTDIADTGIAEVRARLRLINPVARQEVSRHGNVEPSLLFGDGTSIADGRFRKIGNDVEFGAGHGSHSDGIHSFVLRRDGVLTRGALMGFLQMLADQKGDSLLRVKGLVALSDDPLRPAVVHGVQHVVHQISRLGAWPKEIPAGTTLVFIVRGLARAWVEDLLEQVAESPYASLVS